MIYPALNPANLKKGGEDILIGQSQLYAAGFLKSLISLKGPHIISVSVNLM